MRGRITPEIREVIAKLARESSLSYKQIAQRFGVSVQYVSHIAIEDGSRRRKPWTDSDIAFLKQNYQTRGARGCAKVLGRNYCVVSMKARELGLTTSVVSHGRLRVHKGGKGGD